ncbi:MAG TPA: hypothetical protein VFZ00_30695 [Solirubrobacter sp.]|nr:hypothetical protein [Solirubrobacter sp.]
MILLMVVMGAVALAVAACGGGEESGAGSSGASAGVVSVATVDGVDVLANSQGKSLYSAEVEKGGAIRCVDACESFWEPVAASSADAKAAADQIGAKLGVVKRPDGQQQLALDGLPLYTFAEEGAGELQGDGFVDDFQGTHFEWQAARTSGGAPSSEPSDPSGGGYGY